MRWVVAGKDGGGGKGKGSGGGLVSQGWPAKSLDYMQLSKE